CFSSSPRYGPPLAPPSFPTRRSSDLLLGVQRRAVDLEILDRALQQWVRVERAADGPGRTGVAGEQVAGLDVRADTVDRYAVEIGDELLGSGIERRGHGDPVALLQCAVTRHRGLATRSIDGNGRTEVAIPVGRRAEQVTVGVAAQGVYPLPCPAASAPLHPDRDSEVLCAVEDPAWDLHVAAVVTAGKSEGTICLIGLDQFRRPCHGSIPAVAGGVRHGPVLELVHRVAQVGFWELRAGGSRN